MSTELVIRGATVLDTDAPLAEADIRVADGTIVEVGSVSAPGGRGIDARGLVAMPGLINAHTHSGQHLDRGVAPNMPLDLWLMWVVYAGIPFSPDDSYTLAMAGAIDMLSTGCTAVLDHPWVPADDFDEHIEAIESAYAEIGIRCGLAPMIQDRDIFESMAFGDLEPFPALSQPVPPERLLALMNGFLQSYAGRARFTPMIGPSAPQRCSTELMRGLADLATRHHAPFHTHVLETRSQVIATRQRYGQSVVEFLDDIGALTERTSLAHCVWMDSDEYSRVRDAGATIVHNPVSNLRCGSGILPFASLVAGGARVAIGADGAASNDNQNMFEALKIASLVHTLTGTFREWPTAEMIWRACLAGGAAALCAPVGRIAPGHRADIVLLDTDRHECLDRDALVRSLVFAEHGQSVHTVIVDGEVVIEDREQPTVPSDHRARERALRRRVHESLPSRRETFDRYGDVLGQLHDRDAMESVAVQRLASITPAFERASSGGDPASNGSGNEERAAHG